MPAAGGVAAGSRPDTASVVSCAEREKTCGAIGSDGPGLGVMYGVLCRATIVPTGPADP